MKRTSGARRKGARWTAACALAAAAASAGASPASAQPRPSAQPGPSAQPAAQARPGAAARGQVEVQGVVLEINQDDLVLDLGAATGVTENQVIEIWRPFKLKHPVTGRILTDRFKIGQIQIGQVRPAMSLARPQGTLARPAAPGDLVIFTRAVAAPPAPSSPSSAPPSPLSAAGSPSAPSPASSAISTPYDDDEEPAARPGPADVDARNVTRMFEALRGQSIATRITRYEQFLRMHPDSRFVQVLYEESMALRQLLTRAPSPRPSIAEAAPQRPRLESGPGELRGRQGRALRVAVELGGPVKGAVLQLRRKGETLFTTTPMAAAGKGYWAAEIPASRVQDRDLEYFIEAVGERGAAVAVLGGPGVPERIEVEPAPPVRVPPSGTGSVGVLTDFADYNRARGNDWAWQTEGTFGMRFKDLGIRAVRMGFGVYRGVSGTVKELDEDGLAPREVGLTYGYVEGEFGIHRYFSLIGRAAVGLLDEGVSGGGQLFGRIGSDRGTNLLLGGEVLGGVGLRSIIELQLNTFERFPIVLRTEVTNQPAGISPSPSRELPAGVAEGQSDVAGRGIVQVGFRPVPELTLAVRGSFQGRNINHAGPGVGGFVGYTW